MLSKIMLKWNYGRGGKEIPKTEKCSGQVCQLRCIVLSYSGYAATKNYAQHIKILKKILTDWTWIFKCLGKADLSGIVSFLRTTAMAARNYYQPLKFAFPFWIYKGKRSTIIKPSDVKDEKVAPEVAVSSCCGRLGVGRLLCFSTRGSNVPCGVP